MTSFAKKTARVLACLATGLPLLFQPAGADTKTESGVVLQLPYTHQFEFAGIYAAQAQGYFREEGLDVEVRPNTYGKLPIREIKEGRAKYGVYQAMRVLHARLSGEPLVVIAAVFQHSPYALAVLRGSGIHNVQDLVGRRVAIDAEFRSQEIHRMLELEGIDPAKVQIVPNHWDVNELKQGTADAMGVYLIDGPYDLKQQGCDIQLIRPSDYGVDFYGDVLFTDEKEISRHPERVKAMRRAVLRGWSYAVKHQPEMIDWILEHHTDRPARVTRERLEFEAREVARLVNMELMELGAMNPGRWRVQADYLVSADPRLKVERLSGFIYQPAAPGQPPAWVIWLGWSAAVVAVLSLLALLEYYRMQRLVRLRTAALHESETEFRELFEQVPVPVLVESYLDLLPDLEKFRKQGVRDLRGYLAPQTELVRALFRKKRILAVNRLALAKTGFSSLEEFDRRALEVMTEQGLQTFIDELVAIWEGRENLVVEKVYNMKTGQEMHTVLYWQVGRKNGQPDLGRVRLVYADITEQKKAEQGLRESERRYREIFDLSPTALMERDFAAFLRWAEARKTEGVTDLRKLLEANPGLMEQLDRITPLQDFNPAALGLMKAPSKEELFRALPDIFTGEAAEARRNTFLACWEGRTRAEGELQVRRLDGVWRRVQYTWLLDSPKAVGEPRRSLTALVDITEQHAAAEALRHSEERYRQLFENAVGGVYREDSVGNLLSVNPAFARLLGYESPASLIETAGRGFALGFYAKPGRREEFFAQLGDGDRVMDFESEVRVRHGGTIWIAENVRALRTPDGRLQFLDGFVTDITSRRRLEDEMMRASKLEAVGILAGGIAHDFNNILTVVLGNVTLAEMDTDANKSVSRMLRDAKQATLRARDLTQQLLTFAKGGDPVRATVALPELLRESAGFALHGSKARAEYELPGDLWAANVDKGQIGQVVQNLVINAVQAMPQGGTIRLRATNVTLEARAVGMLPAGDYIHLSVADNGVGIPSDHLPKIFDPYFTTKQSGSGLGLATVYSILRKHQGHIEVVSELGVGTTFNFWLPAASHAAEEPPPEAPAPDKLRGRILFMDDEEPIRDMAGMFLERLGIECDLTVEGTETVEKYRSALETGRPYDLVIMDLTVPGGMGGREAMGHLRAIDPSVRAIVSSGYSRDPVLANFRAHGFSGILPKPYSLEQLQQVLRASLGQGRSRSPF